MYMIFFATIIETDQDGVFVDGPFFGGESATLRFAELIAKDLSNDRAISGTVVPKILEYKHGDNQERQQTIRIALQHFNHLARDVYDQEDMLERKKR